MNTALCLPICSIAIIIISSVPLCAGQKILTFDLTISDTTCTVANTVREYLDDILFVATLEYNVKDVDIHSWFLFTIQYVDKSKPDTVRTASSTNLLDCEVTAMPDTSHTCSLKDDRIYLTVPVVAQVNISQMLFFSNWVSLRQGHVRSVGFRQGPTIVAQETETLEVDDVQVLVLVSSIQLVEGTNVRLRYCVANILTHTLVIEFGDKIQKSSGDCVEMEFVARSENVLSVGFDETEGLCKQMKRHYYAMVSDGKHLIMTARHSASCSDNITFALSGHIVMVMVAVLGL